MLEQGLKTSIIQRAVRAYGLEGAQIGAPQKGYRNTSYPITLPSGDQQNIIFYKSEAGILERIKRTNDVSDFVARSGLPARRTCGAIMQLTSATRTRYAARYTYLPGQTISWEAYTQEHLKLLGEQLALLHAALRTYPQSLPSVADEYTTILTGMEMYFSEPAVQQAIREKLGVTVPAARWAALRNLLNVTRNLPGQQALHMDFVRGNILFQEAGNTDRLHISGILDFEKTGYGHPLLDIARTLAFLLVDCKYKPAVKVQKYFLRSGYIKRGGQQLAPETYPLLMNLVHLFLMHDFYKFLRHNPYEFLDQNEHFVRTKHILLRHKLIEYI